MHNLEKIKWFRFLLRLSYFPALILVYPIVFFRKKSKAAHFFFFDRYAMGGAQQVHLDILATIADLPKEVYFTRHSPNDSFRSRFWSVPQTKNADIHVWCDNLALRLFSVHYFSFYLNRQPRATVFSANSTFFYDLLPFLKKDIVKIELLHNFTYGTRGMEFFGLANYEYLDRRMVIDSFTLENIRRQYEENHIPASWCQRVTMVEFGVDIPSRLQKNFTPPLKIFYAGRGGPQKRVWLIDRIARHYIGKNPAPEFHFFGNLNDELSPEVISHSVIHGEITDRTEITWLFAACHILLMTSAYEGFPVVVKEAMALGCIPLVTALEGNKMHVHEGDNGFLLEDVQDEDKIVAHAIARIDWLLSHPESLQKFSARAFQYARENFSKEKFNIAYRELLTGQQQPTPAR